MNGFVEALKAEIAQLEAELERSPTYMKLREARRLLGVYQQPEAGAWSQVGKHEPAFFGCDRFSPGNTAMQQKMPPSSGVGADALMAAKEFIAPGGDPIPTQRILGMLQDRGITFGGKNPQNTLSSILSKSPDFKSNGRSGWTRVDPNSKKLESADSQGEPSTGLSAASADPLLDLLGPAKGREAGPGGGT